MLIETKRVKNYCSTYKTIILIDKDPFCVCNSNRSAHEVIKRLLGGEIELKDKKIEKLIERRNKKCKQKLFHLMKF